MRSCSGFVQRLQKDIFWDYFKNYFLFFRISSCGFCQAFFDDSFHNSLCPHFFPGYWVLTGYFSGLFSETLSRILSGIAPLIFHGTSSFFFQVFLSISTLGFLQNFFPRFFHWYSRIFFRNFTQDLLGICSRDFFWDCFLRECFRDSFIDSSRNSFLSCDEVRFLQGFF